MEALLPTLNCLTLATEKLALGASDLDDVSTIVHSAINPKDPPAISLEEAGALFLYAADCESQARAIAQNAARILGDVQALYYGQASEEQMIGSRARDLVAAWHRDALKS